MKIVGHTDFTTAQDPARLPQVRNLIASAWRYGPAQLDACSHGQFEHTVRDLMRRDGCTDAVQVAGQGEQDVRFTVQMGW